MASITFSPPQDLDRELNNLVYGGRYRDLPTALTEAVALLVQRERASQAVREISAIRNKLAGWQVDVTQAVVRSHEEDG